MEAEAPFSQIAFGIDFLNFEEILEAREANDDRSGTASEEVTLKHKEESKRAERYTKGLRVNKPKLATRRPLHMKLNDELSTDRLYSTKAISQLISHQSLHDKSLVTNPYESHALRSLSNLGGRDESSSGSLKRDLSGDPLTIT